MSFSSNECFSHFWFLETWTSTANGCQEHSTKSREAEWYRVRPARVPEDKGIQGERAVWEEPVRIEEIGSEARTRRTSESKCNQVAEAAQVCAGRPRYHELRRKGTESRPDQEAHGWVLGWVPRQGAEADITKLMQQECQKRSPACLLKIGAR